MSLVQVAANWDALTDAEKAALFESNGVGTPNLSDLATLGQFKIARFSFLDEAAEVNISAVPKDQRIVPSGLISLENFYVINNVTITAALSGGGLQRYAFTPNGTDYYVFASGDWTQIATETVTYDGETYTVPTAAAMAAAMTAADVSAVDGVGWEAFKELGGNLGTCYFLSQSAVSDSCKTDEIAASVTMRGTYKAAVHGTDYDYSYAAEDTLTVTLYVSGDFKISYAGVAE